MAIVALVPTLTRAAQLLQICSAMKGCTLLSRYDSIDVSSSGSGIAWYSQRSDSRRWTCLQIYTSRHSNM